MLRLLLILLLMNLDLSGFAQPGKKSAQQDQPPTQKEMQEMMKEMQNAMDNMSPEDKKLMDSMGIKIPSMKDMPNMSDKQMADALKEANRIVPKRDATRIAAIPKAVTDSKMGAYIVAVQNKVASTLKPAIVSKGNQVYDYIKSHSKNGSEAANMAISLWLAGQPDVALYILGKICATDAGNTDNLSNYSAMLSMRGAQHLAIPILNNLNAKYPNNSTLLNNLGQAWFGLGEIGKAEKYLDSAIRIYAYHPQANLTKSFIEENRGNKMAAIEAVKRSIAKAYSLEKEDRLSKLNYKPKNEDLPWDKPMPQDALGLEKFKWPEYPMSVAESEILEDEWDAFHKKCEEKMEELRIQEKKLVTQVEEMNQARMQQVLTAGQRGVIVDPWPPLAHKAMAKLNYFIDDKDGHTLFNLQKKQQALIGASTEIENFRDIYEQQILTIQKNYKDKFGEGKANPFDAACADDTKAKNAFLSSSNSLLREVYNDYFAFMRRKINNEIYYNQYTMWPENFELAKVQAKLFWLGLIHSQQPKFLDKSIWCQDKIDVEARPFKLANFDEIACNYKSSLNMGCVKMETNCGQTTTTYGCGDITFTERELGQNYVGGTLKISAKAKVGISEGPLSLDGFIGGNVNIELDENNNVKEWKGKVTAGIEGGVGVHEGPVKAGASVTEALEIELGSTGVTDVVIVSAAKVEAGIEAPKLPGNKIADEKINEGVDYVNKGLGHLNTKVEIGVESRSSLVSSHGNLTVSGTGLESTTISAW